MSFSIAGPNLTKMLLVEAMLRSYSTLLGFDPWPDKDLLADIGLALEENNPQKDLSHDKIASFFPSCIIFNNFHSPVSTDLTGLGSVNAAK